MIVLCWKKKVLHEGGVKETERDHVAAFQVSVGWQQGHDNEHWFSHEQLEDGYVRAAEAGAERILRQTLCIGRGHSHRADGISSLDCWR